LYTQPKQLLGYLPLAFELLAGIYTSGASKCAQNSYSQILIYPDELNDLANLSQAVSDEEKKVYTIDNQIADLKATQKKTETWYLRQTVS